MGWAPFNPNVRLLASYSAPGGHLERFAFALPEVLVHPLPAVDHLAFLFSFVCFDVCVLRFAFVLISFFAISSLVVFVFIQLMALFQILYDLKPGNLIMRADLRLEPPLVDHPLRFLPAALNLELAPREPNPREAFLGRLLVGMDHLEGVLRPF